MTETCLLWELESICCPSDYTFIIQDTIFTSVNLMREPLWSRIAYVWYVETIFFISVQLADHENSPSHRIREVCLGDHIEKAPVPVDSAIVTVVVFEIWTHWTVLLEVVSERAIFWREHTYQWTPEATTETQNRRREGRRQSATLGFGHKLKFTNIFLLFI